MSQDHKLFLDDFAENLRSDLKPDRETIIRFTNIAKDYISIADEVVDAIKYRLGRTQPAHRMPIWYLIDSIIKNVGRQYIHSFSDHIVSMFKTTFQDQNMRKVLLKLLDLWKKGKDGKPLFSRDILFEMDKIVSPSSSSSSSSSLPLSSRKRSPSVQSTSSKRQKSGLFSPLSPPCISL